MNLAIGTANPPRKTTQKESLQFVLDHFGASKRAEILYKKFMGHSSIQTRYFALDKLEDILDQDHDRIHARYQKSITSMAAQALDHALTKAKISPQQIDFLVAATCTGYLCPGISSYVTEQCHLRPDIRISDMVGMGCGAGIPALEQAFNFVKANPGSTAAVLCAEISSSAMFPGEDIDLIISNSIFGDGAACIVVNDSLNMKGFHSLILPEWRDSIRFRTEKGFLRNVLSKDVYQKAAMGIQKCIEKFLKSKHLTKENISHWIFHPGGEKILTEIQSIMHLTTEDLSAARSVDRKAHV